MRAGGGGQWHQTADQGVSGDTGGRTCRPASCVTPGSPSPPFALTPPVPRPVDASPRVQPGHFAGRSVPIGLHLKHRWGLPNGPGKCPSGKGVNIGELAQVRTRHTRVRPVRGGQAAMDAFSSRQSRGALEPWSPEQRAPVRGTAAWPRPRAAGLSALPRRPRPQGPRRRPRGPLTLHHLLRLLLPSAALRRHIGCSSSSRNPSPQAPQPIRAPGPGRVRPMRRRRAGWAPARLRGRRASWEL